MGDDGGRAQGFHRGQPFDDGVALRKALYNSLHGIGLDADVRAAEQSPLQAGMAPLVIGLVLSLVYIAAAGVFFRLVHRHAVRTGLIARYSAESVS